MSHTTAEELSLIDRYMQAIGKIAPLKAEEEEKLALRAQKGEAPARDKMIMANLRLVVKIAYDYAGMGVPLVDLISEGNLGLIKAVDRFQLKRGGRLATYAAWWIRQTIKKALADQGKMMRLPMHVVDKIAKLRRAKAKLTNELEREPTVAELARETRYSQKRIAQLQELLSSSVSLETPSGTEGTLGDTLGDEHTSSPVATLLKKANIERVDEILEKMEPRHAQVLKLRHGIDGQPSRTLDEVGALLHLTRERVRQLEMEAEVQLRRVLKKDDQPTTRAKASAQRRSKAKVEVFKQFMVEKGLLK